MSDYRTIGPISNNPDELRQWAEFRAAQRRAWAVANEQARRRLAAEREQEKRRKERSAGRDAKRRRDAEIEAVSRELRMQGATEDEISELVPKIRRDRLIEAAANRDRPEDYRPLM